MSEIDEQPWDEKYRPKSFRFLRGNDKAIHKLERVIRKPNFPRLLLHGPAGTGKTTVVKLVVDEVVGNNKASFKSMNISDQRSIDDVRYEIKDYAMHKAMSTRFKILELNEFEQMTPVAQKAMKTILEQWSHNCKFILVTNDIEKIHPPIISRCATIKFNPLSDMDMRRVIMRVVALERMEITTKGLATLIRVSHGDARSAINTLQFASESGDVKVTSEEILMAAMTPDVNVVEKIVQMALSGKVRKSLSEYRDTLGSIIPSSFASVVSDNYMDWDLSDEELSKVAVGLQDIDTAYTTSLRIEGFIGGLAYD